MENHHNPIITFGFEPSGSYPVGAPHSRGPGPGPGHPAAELGESSWKSMGKNHNSGGCFTSKATI